ncbi:hypothetical protein [Nostoc sp.]|uniref:hypothetical protein n=1 Tax=Nostoc sp. TaxID=1180 RepID=UPI002FFB48E2
MNSAKTIKLLIKQAKYAQNIRNYQEAEVLRLSVIKQKPNDVPLKARYKACFTPEFCCNSHDR